MNIPILLKQLYGEFAFTGLFSFEFVDKKRNTIVEIFMMLPPKSKSVTEATRSSTQPTLGGNYNTDAGNATKNIVLNGELFFPYEGSVDNPSAWDSANMGNKIDGLTEFFKLRWMLMRYRDSTMSPTGEITIPTVAMAKSSEITALYKKVSSNLSKKVGALYDEIQLIFHDYDMDDHWYCRVDNFSSQQSSDKHIAIDYTINLECTEPDSGQLRFQSLSVKESTNASVSTTTELMKLIEYAATLDTIKNQINPESSLYLSAATIETAIAEWEAENEKIQTGKSTATGDLPGIVSTLLAANAAALTSFIEVFLSSIQQALYEAGDLTIDEVVSSDLLIFYNALQQVKIQAEGMDGIIKSIVKQDDIRYYSNADDYTLTTDQFDSGDENIVENTTNFYYYTVMDGDTARIIALRELSDAGKFVNILKLNDISETDFIEGNIIGQKIKIPVEIAAISNTERNLVYESDFSNLEKFVYGTDLSTDTNKRLQISSKGDLLSTTGVENAFNSVTNKITNSKGSLNVFHPNWGTVAVDDGNAPMVVKIDRYLTDMIYQIQGEPRVESVKLDLDKLRIEQETIRASFTVFFLGLDKSREVTT